MSTDSLAKPIRLASISFVPDTSVLGWGSVSGESTRDRPIWVVCLPILWASNDHYESRTPINDVWGSMFISDKLGICSLKMCKNSILTHTAKMASSWWIQSHLSTVSYNITVNQIKIIQPVYRCILLFLSFIFFLLVDNFAHFKFFSKMQNGYCNVTPQ